MEPVPISSMSTDRFREVLGDRYGEVEAAIAEAQKVFVGRVVWHVNSTSRGGGVVELLHSLLAYARGAGVDTRWEVLKGSPEFFTVTKRIHNHLHGWPGDGGELGEAERRIYESTLSAAATELAHTARPGDIVFLHDPQTAGLVAPVMETGALVVWRCHVGLDLPNDLARQAWAFLRPYVEGADAYVFSRREFAWEGLAEDKVWIVPPSIDAFSPKNQDLSWAATAAILSSSGLALRDGRPPVFTRADGTPGRVDHRAELFQDGVVNPDDPLLVQVSRWDRLKDPLGVLRGFAEHIGDDAHLMLAGPAVEAVSDDPEGAEVLAEVREAREALPAGVRARVHLACLPMTDVEENAAIVNALQRRAQVVTQKSLAEGFGLTVAEAMWKGKPVVASRRGGIQDQIVDGESGVLVDDPEDLVAFGRACSELLANQARAEAIGAAARERVRDRFLGTRHLVQYVALLHSLIDALKARA